jgi:hypothetical protein
MLSADEANKNNFLSPPPLKETNGFALDIPRK